MTRIDLVMAERELLSALAQDLKESCGLTSVAHARRKGGSGGGKHWFARVKRGNVRKPDDWETDGKILDRLAAVLKLSDDFAEVDSPAIRRGLPVRKGDRLVAWMVNGAGGNGVSLFLAWGGWGKALTGKGGGDIPGRVSLSLQAAMGRVEALRAVLSSLQGKLDQFASARQPVWLLDWDLKVVASTAGAAKRRDLAGTARGRAARFVDPVNRQLLLLRSQWEREMLEWKTPRGRKLALFDKRNGLDFEIRAVGSRGACSMRPCFVVRVFGGGDFKENPITCHETLDKMLERHAEHLRVHPKLLAGLVAGEPTKAIAADLNISEASVRARLTRLYRRAGVRGRGALVAQLCREQGKSSKP